MLRFIIGIFLMVLSFALIEDMVSAGWDVKLSALIFLLINMVGWKVAKSGIRL